MHSKEKNGCCRNRRPHHITVVETMTGTILRKTKTRKKTSSGTKLCCWCIGSWNYGWALNLCSLVCQTENVSGKNSCLCNWFLCVCGQILSSLCFWTNSCLCNWFICVPKHILSSLCFLTNSCMCHWFLDSFISSQFVNFKSENTKNSVHRKLWIQK